MIFNTQETTTKKVTQLGGLFYFPVNSVFVSDFKLSFT